jgi:hypothetical protein
MEAQPSAAGLLDKFSRRPQSCTVAKAINENESIPIAFAALSKIHFIARPPSAARQHLHDVYACRN